MGVVLDWFWEGFLMGFDFFYGYNCQRQAHTFYPTHLWKNTEKDILYTQKIGATKMYYKKSLHNPYLQFYNQNDWQFPILILFA